MVGGMPTGSLPTAPILAHLENCIVARENATTCFHEIVGPREFILRVLTIPMESLILAQDERWRRASNMQVERGCVASQEAAHSSGERVRNTWGTYPPDGDNLGKPGLIPDTFAGSHGPARKGSQDRWRTAPRPISLLVR